MRVRHAERFAAGWLFVCAVLVSAPAGGQVETTAGDGARVVGVAAPGERAVHLGDRLVVRVAGLDAFLAAEAKRADDLRLFLDGVELTGMAPEAVQSAPGAAAASDVRFRLGRDAENRDAWRSLLGPFRVHPRQLTVGVGLAGGPELDGSSETEIAFQAVREKLFWVFLGLLAALLVLFFWVPMPNGGRLSDSLRDRQVHADPGQKRPFSLARCQMAWWFFLVLGAYVFLWMVLNDLDTLTGSVLTLMGIGSGTALGAAMIDSNKQAEQARAKAELDAAKAAAKAVPELEGVQTVPLEVATAEATAQAKFDRLDGSVKPHRRSVLADLLSDGNGYSFHRFQIVVWTIVLGIIFVVSVQKELAMPQFSEILLGLMGISAGTYLGFKVPERHE